MHLWRDEVRNEEKFRSGSHGSSNVSNVHLSARQKTYFQSVFSSWCFKQLRLSVVSHLHILQSCVSHCVSAWEALMLRVVFAAGQRRNFCGSRLSLISSERGGWWYQGSRWMGDKLGLMVEEMPFRSQTIMLLAQHNRYTHLLLPPLLSLSLIPSSWCNLLLMFLHSF